MPLTIYCLRCKAKTNAIKPQKDVDKNSRPRIKATCSRCHNAVYRYVKKNSKMGAGFFDDVWDGVGTVWKGISDVTKPLRKPFYQIASQLPGAKYLPLSEEDTGAGTDWITENVFKKKASGLGPKRRRGKGYKPIGII